MKPLEVWTCQRAENLKKKSSKISKNNYAAKMVAAARRQIIGGGGGGAPINKSRRRRRSQIVGGGGAARPAHSSSINAFDCRGGSKGEDISASSARAFALARSGMAPPLCVTSAPILLSLAVTLLKLDRIEPPLIDNRFTAIDGITSIHFLKLFRRSVLYKLLDSSIHLGTEGGRDIL